MCMIAVLHGVNLKRESDFTMAAFTFSYNLILPSRKICMYFMYQLDSSSFQFKSLMDGRLISYLELVASN